MKFFPILLPVIILISVISCSKKMYSDDGERIYKTGRNTRGEKLLDKAASRIRIVNNCKTCHGKNGDAMKHVSIRFRDLADPTKMAVPYTDSLFYRFLDKDLKSDGSKANIGIRWKMSDEDKQHLLAYLKTM